MQTTSRENGLSGLIAVLGLLALLVGLIVMILPSTILPRYTAWAILALGIILLAIAFIMDFRRVSGAITGRRGMFGTGTTVMASIFIGIVLLVNAISISSYHRFDLTGVAQFTLTSQTKDVLSQMETPVQALGFFVPNDPYGIRSYATSLLEEYQNYTDLLSIRKIDPDEHPDQARQYGITQYQTVVFETEKGLRLVSPAEIITFDAQGNPTGIEAEHAFTNAILEVTGIVQKKVYFLTGHGEASISADYSQARQGLLDNLYRVDTLDLLRTPGIPDDAAALIIAGPQKSLTSDEVEIIERYLENGGWALILINPNSPSEIKQLLSAWGVKIEDGTVIDPSSYMPPSLDNPIVPRTRNFFGLSTTYFPGVTAIIPHEKVTETIEQSPLVWTSKESWLEKQFETGQEPVFNEGTDLKGPFALGALIITALPEKPEEEAEFKDTRIIVFGDSDFASNQHFYNGDNGDLFLNLVELLTKGKELISIERKALPFRRLVIGPEARSIITYSSIGLLPLLVLVIGGVIWWRRR